MKVVKTLFYMIIFIFAFSCGENPLGSKSFVDNGFLPGTGSSGSGSSNSFSPTSVSGLVAWMDGSDISTMYTDNTCSTQATTNGQAIECWQDKSTQLNHATQSTNSSAPTYDSTNNALSFDGTDDWLDFSTMNGFPANANPRTLFLVARYNTDVGGFRFTFGYGNPTVPNGFGFGQSGATCYFFGFGDDVTSGSCISASTSYIISGTYDGTTASFYMNGTLANSAAKAWNTTPLTSGRIGRQINAAAEFHSGLVYEALLFDTSFNQTSREQIEGYLACKYGLQGSLPGIHPYSSNCP